MQTSSAPAHGHTLHTRWERWFPAPRYVTTPACGIDISDTSVKALQLKPTAHGWEVEHYESIPIPEGVVAEGAVHDVDALAYALNQLTVKKETPYAHAALSEEASYVFQMQVSDTRNPSAVRTMIEFELEGRVPLALKNSTFDYDIIALSPDGIGAEIAVSVFARDSVSMYISAFGQAGFTLLSLELEAQSVARAVVPFNSTETVMLVDFGRGRTGVAIVKHGVPIFTRTVGVGGNAMSAIIADQLHITPDEAELYKNEHGLDPAGDPKVVESVTATANALSEEIGRHYQYWNNLRDEHGTRTAKIDRVVLCGGNSNLHGLPEFIASKIHAPVERADVWRNVCSYDEYIPPIIREHSLGYATAIGLALRNT